jgi:hypothetical protein
MPNGFHHRDELDVLTLAYTEQNYPEFHVRHTREGVRMLHVRGIRGYAPIVDWHKYVEPRHEDRAYSRASVEALAGRYGEAIAAALDNPNDILSREVRRASLAWLAFEAGWVIAIGNYYVYGRTGGAWVHLNASPLLAELPPDVAPNIIFSEITPDGLRTADSISGCVVELAGCDELLCGTVPLHFTPEWPRLSALAVDDEAATGALVTCMRRHALRCEQDVVVARWRRPEK